MSRSYDNTNNVKIDIIDDSSADEQIQIKDDIEAIKATAFEESSITDLATGPTPLASSSADNSSEVVEPADNPTEVAEDHDDDDEETAENTAAVVVEVQISDDEEDDEDYVEGQSELIAAEEDDGELQEAISLLVEEEDDEADEDDEVSLSVIEKECVDLLTDMQDGEVNSQAFTDITEVISEIKQKVESKQLEAVSNEADVTPLKENQIQSRKRSRDEVYDDEEEDEKSDDNDEEPTQKKQATSALRGFTKFALGTIVGSALTIAALIATSPTNQ